MHQFHSFNTFTAPGCKISGLKMHGRACKRYILQSYGYDKSAFNAMSFDENPFTCHCQKEDKNAKGFQISQFYCRFSSNIMAVKGLSEGSFHSGSVSWCHCRPALPGKLHVISFPWLFPTLFWDSTVRLLAHQLCWLKGVYLCEISCSLTPAQLAEWPRSFAMLLQ